MDYDEDERGSIELFEDAEKEGAPLERPPRWRLRRTGLYLPDNVANSSDVRLGFGRVLEELPA